MTTTDKKRFHVTWFIDNQKRILKGTTVDAKDISDALKKVLKMEITLMSGDNLDVSMIKYVMEL